MEKLAYGLSLLTVVYLAFLYLTMKTVLRDMHTKDHSTESKEEEIQKKNKHTGQRA